MKKRSLIALLLCAVLLLTCGCTAKPKTFTASGMTIELTEDFAEKEMVGFTAVYQSKDVFVFALKEEFEILGDSMDLDEYADLVLEANQMDADVEHEGEHTYFTFDKTVSGKDMTYTAVLYKGEDAYWMIQFACLSKDYDDLKDTIFGYAASVEV
jgi:hypothetical protein